MISFKNSHHTHLLVLVLLAVTILASPQIKASEYSNSWHYFTLRYPLAALSKFQNSTVTNSNPTYSGECATGAQFLTGTSLQGILHDAPPTKTWREGPQVSNNTPPGTLIARGWIHGRYPSASTCEYQEGGNLAKCLPINHAGLFLGMNRNETIKVFDQFHSFPLGGRNYESTGWHVVLSKQPYDLLPSKSKFSKAPHIAPFKKPSQAARNSHSLQPSEQKKPIIILAPHNVGNGANKVLDIRLSRVSFQHCQASRLLRLLTKAIAHTPEHVPYFSWGLELVPDNMKEFTDKENTPVSLSLKNVTLKAVLDDLCRQTGWSYQQTAIGILFRIPTSKKLKTHYSEKVNSHREHKEFLKKFLPL